MRWLLSVPLAGMVAIVACTTTTTGTGSSSGSPSGSSGSSGASGNTSTRVCCIQGDFYECPDQDAYAHCGEPDVEDYCPLNPDRAEECGGGSSGSSGSSGSTPAKEKGDSCECDATGTDDTVYFQCTGNASACYTLSLACLANMATGEGQCVIPCSKSEANTQGKCPSGSTCLPSSRKGVDGNYWHTCQ